MPHEPRRGTGFLLSAIGFPAKRRRPSPTIGATAMLGLLFENSEKVRTRRATYFRDIMRVAAKADPIGTISFYAAALPAAEVYAWISDALSSESVIMKGIAVDDEDERKQPSFVTMTN